MKNYLTAHDIANNARMIRTLHPGTILIVEGNTDIRVYERFVNDTYCKLIPANGKDKTIDALAILEKDNYDGVLAIVDTDFWKLDGIEPNTPNLLLTDTHDLETMLLSSDALDKILSEFGSATKIKKLGKPIRDILLKSALPIGYFRWLSSPTKDNLFLKFKEFCFPNFVDKKTLSVAIDKLIKEVKTNSQHSTFDGNVIQLKIETLIKNNAYDPWHVCSGHDLVQILSIGLKNIFGNNKARTIATELLDGILRVAYEYSHFCLTKLHNAIKDWEKMHPSFKVLNGTCN